MKIDGKDAEDYLKSQPKDQVKSALKTTTTVLMALEFIVVVGFYIFLRQYASLHYAEIWMLIMYAWALKSSADAMESKIAMELEKSNGDKSKEKNNRQSKDIEECNDKDSSSN